MSEELIELPPAPPVISQPTSDPIDKQPLRLDLACGQVCSPGFVGVDIAACEGVTHVHDLSKPNWPFENDSVDEARCSHFLEHLNGLGQIVFFNELYRVLKPGAGCIITTPFGWHDRAVQDPTHRRAIVFACYLYQMQGWREANKLTHGPYATMLADLEPRSLENQLEPYWAMRSQETKQWAAQHTVNTIPDMNVLVIKPKEPKPIDVSLLCGHNMLLTACPFCDRKKAAVDFVAALKNGDDDAADSLVRLLELMSQW